MTKAAAAHRMAYLGVPGWSFIGCPCSLPPFLPNLGRNYLCPQRPERMIQPRPDLLPSRHHPIVACLCLDG
jgi:hypothetical protein